MAKKGTPEYEIWKKKFLEKRAINSSSSKSFESCFLTTKIVKNLKNSLIDENDLLLFMFLSDVDPNTLSVSALDSVKEKFSLLQYDFDNLVGFFKTLSKDILKLRLHGLYNFYKVNSAPDSYPQDFREKYTKDNFIKKYGYSLDLVFKAKSL